MNPPNSQGPWTSGPLPDPAQLLDQVFESVLAECRLASDRIAAGDAAGKCKAINRALELVETLQLSLVHADAPELCAQLASLYLFVEEKLADANRLFDVAPVHEAAAVMETLREAFADVARTVKVEEESKTSANAPVVRRAVR